MTMNRLKYWFKFHQHQKAKIEYEFKETLDKQICYQWIKKFKGIKWHTHSLIVEISFKEKNFSTIGWKFKSLYEILYQGKKIFQKLNDIFSWYYISTCVPNTQSTELQNVSKLSNGKQVINFDVQKSPR